MKKLLFLLSFLPALSTPLSSQTPEELYLYGRVSIDKKIDRQKELKRLIAGLEEELRVETELMRIYEEELAELKKVLDKEDNVWNVAFDKVSRLSILEEMKKRTQDEPDSKTNMKLFAAGGGLLIVVAGILGIWFWNVKGERDIYLPLDI